VHTVWSSTCFATTHTHTHTHSHKHTHTHIHAHTNAHAHSVHVHSFCTKIIVHIACAHAPVSHISEGMKASRAGWIATGIDGMDTHPETKQSKLEVA
jgi:cyanate permease